MATDCDATISSGGLHVTYVSEIVSSIQGNSRIVEWDLRPYNSKIRVISEVLGGSGNGGDEPMSDKISEMDGRLRDVERAVERMSERLTHMPTTFSMWAAITLVSLTVGSGVVAVLWFAFQKMLEPLLVKAAGG